MYYRGLKDNVKDELIRSSKDYNSLYALIIVAINIEDKLYERSREKRYIE